MSVRSARRAAAAFLIAALLVAGASAVFYLAPASRGPSSAINVAGSTTIQVTAEAGFAFTPNSFGDLAVNSTITVTFTDNDASPHTFTIVDRQGWVIPSDYSSSQINALAYGSTPALLNLNASAVGGAGDVQTGNFTVHAPGWYEFVCTEPGHFQQGMYGFVAFGIPVPSNLSVSTGDTGPGVAVFIIVGTIVSLVVIALVLGFVVGRRRGDTYEMPPQRLGYLEPEAPGSAPPAPTEDSTTPGGPRG